MRDFHPLQSGLLDSSVKVDKAFQLIDAFGHLIFSGFDTITHAFRQLDACFFRNVCQFIQVVNDRQSVCFFLHFFPPIVHIRGRLVETVG